MAVSGNPYADVASTAFDVAGSIWGGPQYDPKDAGDVHLANAGQQSLYNALLGRVMGGAGDFGAGANIKQGKSQLAQFMNDRGINPQSGAGIAGMADMIGTAEAGANQNRLGYAMNLLRSPLQTVQTAGSNWLPESPSYGYDPTAQWTVSARNRRAFEGRTGRQAGQITA